MGDTQKGWKKYKNYKAIIPLDAYHKFLKNSELKAFDVEHRKRINFNTQKYEAAVLNGKKQYSNLEKAKVRAAYLKYKALNELDKYLIQFEDNFKKRGGKVIWAQDKKEAVEEILKIAKQHHAKKVVKSKSMISEEIELNASLQKSNIESIETDLGEYIVQLANEKPYHIVTPAMHKSKEDVAALFHDKFGTPEEYSPEKLTAFVRKILREKFIEADIGISGANFLIADTGSIALTENEGNGMMSMSFPGVHIAIAGIERIIPALQDLDLFWPLLATHGTGQYITSYNSIVSGPQQKGEADGPQEMYVVLLDNNRTNVLAQERQRQALSCIRCGACLNVCPVYKNVGGHTYAATYSGPIGAVINPFLSGMKNYSHQSFASSLCGSCTDICPVKIPLHKFLLLNRNTFVKAGYVEKSERRTQYLLKKILLKRKNLDYVGGKWKNIVLKKFIKKSWGIRRELPVISQKSFNQQWREQKG